MLEIGNRRRAQAPPPHVVFEALTNPHRDSARPWLELLEDEQEPRVLQTTFPSKVVWSSLWSKRDDVVIHFELSVAADSGTDLRWILYAQEPMSDDSFIGHVRKRLNTLINANLRHSFGQ